MDVRIDSRQWTRRRWFGDTSFENSAKLKGPLTGVSFVVVESIFGSVRVIVVCVDHLTHSPLSTVSI